MSVVNSHGSLNFTQAVENLFHEVGTNIGIDQDLINQTSISVFTGIHIRLLLTRSVVKWPITYSCIPINQQNSIVNFDLNRIDQLIQAIPDNSDEIIDFVERLDEDELIKTYSKVMLIDNFAPPKRFLQGIMAHLWGRIQNDLGFPFYEFALRCAQCLSIICFIGTILGAYSSPILLAVVLAAFTVSVISQKLIAGNWQERAKTADLFAANREEYRIGVIDHLKFGRYATALGDKLDTGTARLPDDLYSKAKQWIFQNFFSTHPSYSERIAYLSRPVA